MKGLFGFGAHGRWFLMVVLLLGITPLSQAADLGKTFIVDPNALDEEDHDHDYVFKTLDALLAAGQIPRPTFNDTIILKAGDHHGNIILSEDGVTLRGEYGQDQTWLRGSLTISASHVTVDGLSIDASGLDYGLIVEDDNIALTNVNARLAEIAGIRLNRVSHLHIDSIEAINNGSAGLLAEDADDVFVTDSLFQSNGADGMVLLGSSTVNISNSNLNLNNSYGLRLEESDEIHLVGSTLTGNELHGVFAASSARSTITDNSFNGNGGFGVGLNHSSTFIISNNTFSDNGGLADYSGGVLLIGDSLENTVLNNEFHAHSNPMGAGVWLVGTASANRVLENTFSQNYIGVGLDDNDDGRPQENLVARNNIQGSQIAGVWSNGQDNEYLFNNITGSNGPGFLLEDTEGESVEANNIDTSSQAGVLARRTTQLRVEANNITASGSGVWGDHLSQSDIKNNSIAANFGPGIHASNSDLIEISGNLLSDNIGAGIRLDGSMQVDVFDNDISEHGKAGLMAESASNIEIENNQFSDNHGGLKFADSEEITLRFNDVVDNDGYGLEVIGSDVDAIKNFWGRKDGPSGVAPSNPSGADGVSGLHIDHVFPWLSQSAKDVEARSVAGWYFDIAPQDHWLSAPFLDVTLGISAMQAERGWITVYRHADPFSDTDQRDFTQHFAVTTGGTISGELDLVVRVDTEKLPDGVALEAVRLLRWTMNGWEAVPSTMEDSAATLRGSVAVDGSQDFLFLIGWDEASGS